MAAQYPESTTAGPECKATHATTRIGAGGFARPMQSGAGQLKHALLALTIAFFGAAWPAHAEPRLKLVSNLVWEHKAKWFGGFSGAEISSDGTSITLISDRGVLVQARLLRDGDNITAVEITDQQPILRSDGQPYPKSSKDAEGLAISQGNRGYISFEHDDRVATIDLSTGTTTPLPRHPDFDTFSENTGLETLAIHPDGRLFAVSERKADQTGTTPIYSYSRGRWEITHHLPLSGPFRPVGADFDATGRLYLLERALSPLGFRSRVRRIDLNKSPVSAQTLLTTYPAAFDNLEAITVWTDADGTDRVTMISDDNFLPLQITQIVELKLTE